VQNLVASDSNSLDAATQTCRALKAWLLEHAYPRWWAQGADLERGGFFERVAQDGTGLVEPRRARVNPRQIYCYSLAEALGWNGPARQAVQHGLDYFLEHYRRDDRLFRGLVEPSGAVVTERAVLYDQAFALLAFASAYKTFSREEDRQRARELHDVLRARLGHHIAGFEESTPRITPLISNSHMHMLEASLEWMELDQDPVWDTLAKELVELALTCFIDPGTGFVLEFFDRDWRPAPGVDGRVVEPGHQYEWAWLLLRWSARRKEARSAQKATDVAYRLVALAEAHGVDRTRGVVMNTMLTDRVVRDAQARLWPQTERIKAACTMAELTGDPSYWRAADEAARALQKYLTTPLLGLWYDKITVEGTVIDEPAPASTFYHIVCAISEMDQALQRAAAARS
jgi:mannose/cellobiose epimerase-like protein (N-acyl-D-glucosamine 2-epimerase family)